MVWLPKPDATGYAALVERHGVDPSHAAMIDDIPRNLEPAAALGMGDVWVRENGDPRWTRRTSGDDHIHHVTGDLAAWLEALARSLRNGRSFIRLAISLASRGCSTGAVAGLAFYCRYGLRRRDRHHGHDRNGRRRGGVRCCCDCRRGNRRGLDRGDSPAPAPAGRWAPGAAWKGWLSTTGRVRPMVRSMSRSRAAVMGAEGQRHALGAGARGAADAVDIAFRHFRQFEIHHMGDAVDIDAAGGDVGGDENPRTSGAEFLERPLARRLALVAVDCVGGNAGG